MNVLWILFLVGGFGWTFHYVLTTVAPGPKSRSMWLAALMVTPVVFVCWPWFAAKYLWYWGFYHCIKVGRFLVGYGFYFAILVLFGLGLRNEGLKLTETADVFFNNCWKLLEEIRLATNAEIKNRR